MIDKTLKCLDVQAWRLPTSLERKEYWASKGKTRRPGRGVDARMLAVRTSITTLDMYCYLKARFGVPNGLQSTLLINKNTSDNYVHWDFIIKSHDQTVYVMGFHREFHFYLSESLTESAWKQMITGVKEDFARVGKQKSEILHALEKWVVFPNKYVQIANACSELHAAISDIITDRASFKRASFINKRQAEKQHKELQKIHDRAAAIHNKCLQLSLLTPVLAEAFINMIILMLCKPDIRSDKRQFDSFIRQNIDTKILDLFYKCDGLARQIKQDSPIFSKFRTVMNKRNHAIHGNIDPEGEMLEIAYFEGRTPLSKEGGDAIGIFLDAMERLYRPQEVIDDYLDVHMFLEEIVGCIKPDMVDSVRRILEDPKPGYDYRRKKTGSLFPETVIAGYLPGIRYDDEL